MCKRLGPAGSGQLTKMVNQICIAGLVQGLSEGIHFAKKSGLDVAAVIDTISKGAAQSWQMENRYKTMNDGKYDFGFAVEWMRKDLSICIAESAPQRREPAGDRAGRSVLFRGREDGRQALGHLQPAGAAGALSRPTYSPSSSRQDEHSDRPKAVQFRLGVSIGQHEARQATIGVGGLIC